MQDHHPESSGPCWAAREARGHPAVSRGLASLTQHEQPLHKQLVMDSATRTRVPSGILLPCAGKEKLTTARVSRAPCPSPALSDVDADELSRGNFEVGFRPQKSVRGEREQQQEAGEHGQQGGGPGPEAVARLARPKEGAPAAHSGPAELQSCSPGWCSAFYEADCFGADVSSYVKDLVRQRAGGATDVDAQSPVSPGPLPTAGRVGEEGAVAAEAPWAASSASQQELPVTQAVGGASRAPPCVPRLGPHPPPVTPTPVWAPSMGVLCSSACVLHISGRTWPFSLLAGHMSAR